MVRRTILALAACLAALLLSSCAGLDTLWPGDAETGVLDVRLFYHGAQYASVVAHPTDLEGGLPVELVCDVGHYVDWGDGGPIEWSDGNAQHTYKRAGVFVLDCWTEDRAAVATLTVQAVNERPEIGDTLLLEDSLEWRQAVMVWLNPHAGGCDSATGRYLYAGGVYDPDGDETRQRVRAAIVQEYLVDGVVSRYEVVGQCSVYSVHDRRLISGQWADVWGFWLAVGHVGAVPPYPFTTYPHAMLAPDYAPAPALLSAKAWGGPDWPDPGDCPDCGPDGPGDGTPGDSPSEAPEEAPGACYLQITQESMDRWGGYRGLTWRYRLASCSDDTCGSAQPGGGGAAGGGLPCG